MEETYLPYHQCFNRQFVYHIQIMLQSCNTNTTANFRRKVVEQLIQAYGENSAAHGRPAPRIFERLTGRHFMDRLEEGGKSLHRQCIVCGPAEREMLPPMRSGEKRPSRCCDMTCYKCKSCMFQHVLKSAYKARAYSSIQTNEGNF